MISDEKFPLHDGPDFSAIDSLEKATQLFQEGGLEKLYLMPLEFGGEDVPLNTLYVPLGVANVKREIDVNVIGQLVEDGSVTEYSAEPEYQGDSFIPIAIHIRASNPGEFNTQIQIWGEALSREVDS